MGRTLSLIVKKENTDYGIKKSKLRPNNDGEYYIEVQVTSDGKNILLRSQTQINLYDITYEKLHSFEI